MILSTRSFFILALFLALSFGWSQNEPPPPAAAEAAPSETLHLVPEGPKTDVEADHIEMHTLEEETVFFLTGKVKVTGNNLRVFCDRLEVYAAREGAKPPEGPVNVGGIKRILAIGNVRVEQEDRVATSGRAEVFAVEGRIVFTESPSVRNPDGIVSGEEIILYQGESRAEVRGGESGPARVTLPTLPDLGSSGQRRPRDNEQPID